MASPATTPPKRKPAPKPKPAIATTPAEQERLDKLREYARRGGLAGKKPKPGDYKDETQAFDSIRDKWTYISHKLADKALQAARSTKNIDGKQLVALCTSAGIAYDKRWSKATADNTEIAMPASLVREITAACIAPPSNPAITKETPCMVYEEPCNHGESSDDPAPAPQPAPDAGPEAGG